MSFFLYIFILSRFNFPFYNSLIFNIKYPKDTRNIIILLIPPLINKTVHILKSIILLNIHIHQHYLNLSIIKIFAHIFKILDAKSKIANCWLGIKSSRKASRKLPTIHEVTTIIEFFKVKSRTITSLLLFLFFPQLIKPINCIGKRINK